MEKKKELYEILRSDGAKLKAINFYTIEQLAEMYLERFGVQYTIWDNGENNVADNALDANSADDTVADGEIRTLVFNRGGWCDELQKSYAMGLYRPETAKEYAILKQYASEVL